MYQRLGLQAYHDTAVSAAFVDTVGRFAGTAWGPSSAVRWERGGRRALRLAERAAGALGDGPQVMVGEVESRSEPVAGVVVLTVRPVRRLRYEPGQALPVGTPRLPGRWRWLSPANAPRPDGRLEFHVRAVARGVVSPLLVGEVMPGETVWLGPPADVGLSLARAGGADLLLAAGGTGLAPLRAMVEQVVVSPGDRRVTLVVGARTLFDLYDAVALDKLADAHRRWLTVVPTFCHDPAVEPAAQGDLLTVARYHHRPGQAFFVCGPPALIEAARVRLPAAGVAAGSCTWRSPSSGPSTPPAGRANHSTRSPPRTAAGRAPGTVRRRCDVRRTESPARPAAGADLPALSSLLTAHLRAERLNVVTWPARFRCHRSPLRPCRGGPACAVEGRPATMLRPWCPARASKTDTGWAGSRWPTGEWPRSGPRGTRCSTDRSS
ncbi:FAD-binding oxidoreductase [Micromonospora sp. LOL_024]|uniref:FAD-binding oxidoreductase n=1 Tax=Micromonospora sp. LOL_024 TaxID=3345412 RepID=UPI003A84049A